jgi:hypothetical protein
MKNITKNKRELVLGALSILAVIAAVVWILTGTPEEQVQPAPDGNEADVVELHVNEDEAAPEKPKPQTPASPATTTTPPATTTAVIEVTLAPVEIPNDEVMDILEEFDVQVVERPPATQTTPRTEEQRPPGTTKVVDGKKYVWHPVLGWGEDNGSGTVTVMDVESGGYSYYIEPDGSVNLGKVITPNGSVISYDEYLKIREAR